MKRLLIATTALAAAALTLHATTAAAATVYVDGVSLPLTGLPAGAYDLGTHLPSYIGGSVGSASGGTLLDANRVYFFDNLASTDDPQTATPFNVLVWQFTEAKDSLRLYTHQDHLSGDGLADTDFEAQDVMEYSVFGCNGPTGGCADAAGWVFLSDVVAFADVATGKPTYTFSGTEAAVVYRRGSAEFGLVNAYTRDYHFGTAYNFYGMRSSSISFAQDDADPELDAVIAFNQGEIPEPGTALLVGSGLCAVGSFRRSRTVHRRLRAGRGD